MKLRSLIGAGTIVLAATLAAACDDDEPIGPAVGTIVLEPAADTLSVSETLQLEATVLNADGEPITEDVAFTSSASGIVTVSDTGLVTATGPGEATITAEAGGLTATATLFVRSASSIAVAPTDVQLPMDATQALTVTVLDADDEPIADPAVAFSSSDEAVATVDANGIVTAVGPGSAVITAEVEGLTADVEVTVEAVAVGSVVVDPATTGVVAESGGVADTTDLTVQ